MLICFLIFFRGEGRSGLKLLSIFEQLSTDFSGL
jgi:hypothetical protein